MEIIAKNLQEHANELKIEFQYFGVPINDAATKMFERAIKNGYERIEDTNLWVKTFKPED